jgi:flagellar protein FliO/FliZ
MDALSFLRAIAALGATVALIGLAAWAAHRMGLLAQFGATAPRPLRQRRLQVVEAIMLGPRQRLVIVRAGENEHLILLGQRETVIESRSAQAPEPSGADARPAGAP